MTEPPGGAAAFRYRAFISYSHRDAAWADWLHKSVERYRVPRTLVGATTAAGVVPPRLTPLFRDREELAASTDLSAVITAALAGASHLVVLCSPRAARSKWVNEEILAFKRLGREDRIVAIIVDGEPNSADPATECFPAALRFRLRADGEIGAAPAEPVAADARETGDGKDNAKLKLIAGLLGVGFDALKRREAQAQRRRTLFAYALTGIFALLAVAAVFFAISAERQRAVAEANLKSALENASTLTFDIARKSRDAEGVRRSLMIEILKPTIRLLEGLAAHQAVPAEVRLTQATALNELAFASYQAGLSEDVLDATGRALGVTAPGDGDGMAADGLANERILALILQGDALRLRGRMEEGEASYASALAIGEALTPAHGDEPPFARNIFMALARPGTAQLDRGDLEGARAGFARARAAVEAFIAAHPDEPEGMRGLASIMVLTARVAVLTDDFAAAATAYRAAIEASRRRAGLQPHQTEPRVEMAMEQSELSAVLAASGAEEDAVRLIEGAVRIAEDLRALDPSDAFVQRVLFAALHGLASLHLFAGRLDDAGKVLDRALELVAARGLPGDDDPTGLTDRADALDLAGIYLARRFRMEESRTAIADAAALMRKAVARDGANTMTRERLYRVLFDLGRTEGMMGLYDRALATLEEARAGLSTLAALKPYDRNLRAAEGYANLRIAEIKFTTGDREGARRSYLAARAIFAALKAEKPGDAAIEADLSLIDAMLAGLGESTADTPRPQ